MKEIMLGIDIGTQSIRIALVNKDGKILGIRQRSHFIKTPKENWAVQNPDSWWNVIKEECPKLIEEIGVKKEQIVSIGVDGHMHAAVPIDIEGKLLSNEVQLYCDKRNAKVVEDFILDTQNSEKIYNLTANLPITNWIGFKIKWLKDNQPDIYNRTWKFLTTKDYINFCLTGKVAIDVTEASGTFLMDCETCQWSDVLIKEVGIDIEKLPDIYESYECIGKVTEEVAEILGVKSGIPVAAGCGDTMANLMVTGMTEYGILADITGTGSTICLYTEKPVKDKRLMNLRYSAQGWLAFGCLDSSGAAYRWFKDTLSESDTYESLNELAQQTPPGAEKLFFYPYLSGERTLGSVHSKGMFIGLSTRHTRGHMVRAIQEGIAFEHKRALEIMKDAGYNIDCVYHSGGAAKGDLWNKIKADVYGTEVRTIEESESAVLGAAILGGKAAGLYSDLLEKAKELLKIKQSYEPNLKNQKMYQEYFEIYKEIHDVLQPSFNKLGNMNI